MVYGSPSYERSSIKNTCTTRVRLVVVCRELVELNDAFVVSDSVIDAELVVDAEVWLWPWVWAMNTKASTSARRSVGRSSGIV